MKNKTSKAVAYYEALPYGVQLRRDEDGDFVARIEELPGCMAHGPNESAAIEGLRSMFRLWIEDALDAGDPIPEPEPGALPSGKWVQRVPRRLHRDLAQLAETENVSLNQLVTSMLSEGLTVRTCAQIAETRMKLAMKPPRTSTGTATRTSWRGSKRNSA